MAVLPTTLTEPSSNEERWSKWLEVGFGAAAAIAAVYVCIAKILDRRRKMKDRVANEVVVAIRDRATRAAQDDEQSPDAQVVRPIPGNAEGVHHGEAAEHDLGHDFIDPSATNVYGKHRGEGW